MALIQITSDLQSTIPDTLEVPPLFYNNDSLEMKMKMLYRQLLRSKRMKNRILMIFYAYRLGEILEVLTETPLQRALCMQVLTAYYQRAAIRTYYIYEMLGEEQIFRSQYTTLTMIYRLTHPEFQNLVQVAKEVASVRFISLEQDN